MVERWRRFERLTDFRAATGHEAHGVEVGRDVFVNAPTPKMGRTYATDDVDLGLASGGIAVNAGQQPPNVNDDFSGKAPDLGCRELGGGIPVYGPLKPSN